MNASDLVGTWQLVSLFVQSEQGGEVAHPLGQKPQGLLVYGQDGGFSATVTSGGRRPFAAADILRGTPEEKVAAAETCLAYAGRWSFKAGRVVHGVEVSLFPNWVGALQERIAHLTDEGRLELATDPMDLGGVTRRAVALWERLESALEPPTLLDTPSNLSSLGGRRIHPASTAIRPRSISPMPDSIARGRSCWASRSRL